MKKIPLTQDKVALIDDTDYPLVTQHNWHAHPKSNGSICYARSNVRPRLLMHRLILGPAPDQMVDHIDGNGLNNCRSNLRLCSNSLNRGNSTKKYKGTSKYKGVCWDRESRKWRAFVTRDYKKIGLGRFSSEIDAARAYDMKARELFGEFARTNF